MTGYRYAATYVRAIDGDTVVLDVDVGFRLTARLPIRLLGINAPEKNQRGGSAATAFTHDWLSSHSELVVATEKDPEKYGRWLGTVSAAGESVTLNDALIASGLVVAYLP